MDQPPSRKSIGDVAEEAAKPETALSPHKVLELDCKSANGRRSYKGKFPYKVPTMGDRVDIATLRAQYTQQVQNVAADGVSIADMIAYLNVTLDQEKCPDWWKESKFGIDLYDYTPIMELNDLGRAYEATFLGDGSDAGGDEGTNEDGSGADADRNVDDNVSTPPDGRQVLASFGKGGSGADPDDAGG